ncbi:hypothetical protein LCGC14_1834540 [marine sediment metagenome]|uniref:Uncharacterized protein n=1 Tax=marine sediment metagenome TaxID=412755 RepID=A0A0F9JEK9_9ZZZZ
MKEIYGVTHFDDVNELMQATSKMSLTQQRDMLLDIVWKLYVPSYKELFTSQSRRRGLLSTSYNTAKLHR